MAEGQTLLTRWGSSSIASHTSHHMKSEDFKIQAAFHLVRSTFPSFLSVQQNCNPYLLRMQNWKSEQTSPAMFIRVNEMAEGW